MARELTFRPARVRPEQRFKSRTEPTPEEKVWWSKLVRLIGSMPDSMKLQADGDLNAICIETAHNQGFGDFKPLLLKKLDGICDGGDPWTE